MAPIRCENIDLEDIIQAFPTKRCPFPMTYLGLPLSVRRLKRIHFQPLKDKVATKLIPWVGKYVTFAGRSTLVKAMLTSVVIYFMTVLEVPVEVLMKIDSIPRAYHWAACDKVIGGKCKVNWELVCKPKEYGGLRILNLAKFSSALRLRWLCNEWNETPRPWVDLGTPCSTIDKELFAAATTLTIGNGKKKTFFGRPRGLMGCGQRMWHHSFLPSQKNGSAR
jgi:hypothetical protein